MSKTVIVFLDLGGVLCLGESLNQRSHLIFRSIYGMLHEVEDMISILKNPPTEIEINDVIKRCHRLYEPDLFYDLIDYNLFFGIATNSPKEVVLFTEKLSFIQQDLVMISSLVGVSKPELEFFKMMVDISKKYSPHKILFVDDKKNIVDAANLVPQITAIHFDNTEGGSLYEFIKKNLNK